MTRYVPSHAQRHKEDIWVLRTHRFCGTYRPQLPFNLLVLQQTATSI